MCIWFFAITHYIKTPPAPNGIKNFIILLATVLLITGVLNTDKWYTAVTFISLSVYLFTLLALKVQQSFEIISYLAILPFFFLANGLLTGSYLDEPIVWYNDSENLGFRMFTIPMEDTFYGMLLILMNLNLYQYFKKRF